MIRSSTWRTKNQREIKIPMKINHWIATLFSRSKEKNDEKWSIHWRVKHNWWRRISLSFFSQLIIGLDSIVSGPIVLFASVTILLLSLILLFYCCRTKDKSLFTCRFVIHWNKSFSFQLDERKEEKRASIQSFEQLFFTGSSTINSIDPTIERWTNIVDPKFSFYR